MRSSWWSTTMKHWIKVKVDMLTFVYTRPEIFSFSTPLELPSHPFCLYKKGYIWIVWIEFFRYWGGIHCTGNLKYYHQAGQAACQKSGEGGVRGGTPPASEAGGPHHQGQRHDVGQPSPHICSPWCWRRRRRLICQCTCDWNVILHVIAHLPVNK